MKMLRRIRTEFGRCRYESIIGLKGMMLAGLMLCVMVWSGGCKKPAPGEPGNAQQTSAPSLFQPHLNQAQPKLPTLKVWLGDQELITEMCLTDVQRSTGMMFRKDIGENEAMLFVFGGTMQAAFYMKNTTVPLSAAYISPEGKILEIHDLQPLVEASVTAATDQVQYVLEVRQGWFARHKIGVGAMIRTERGTLTETFFKSR